MANITMKEASEFVFHKCEDETVNNLMNKLSNRAINSNEKHGNTINNVKKQPIEWVREALEEAMDLCVYLQRAIEEMEENYDAELRNLPTEESRPINCN